MQNKPRSNDYGPNCSLSENVIAVPGFFEKKGAISNFFTDDDLRNLSAASKRFDAVVTPELNKHLAPKILKLLTHVVRGEEAEARAMIDKNPGLLLVKTQVEDFQGRIIIATPFQAALAAGDKPMWEMMLPYLERLKSGEALRQFQEWFPEGFEEGEIPASALKDYYNELARAIIHDADGGKAAIERFRVDISSQKEIRQGKIFSLQHLIAAYQAYIDNFDALGTWPKRDLFWNQVIGYVQRQMSTYDAQVHCSGVQSVLDSPANFKRSLKFANGGEFLPAPVNAGVGVEFGVYSYYSGVGAGGRGSRVGCRVVLKNYVEQKQVHWQDLESRLSQERLINLSNRF